MSAREAAKRQVIVKYLRWTDREMAALVKKINGEALTPSQEMCVDRLAYEMTLELAEREERE